MAIDIMKRLGVMSEDERFAREHRKLDQKQMERRLGNVVTVLAKVDRMSEDRIKKAISDLESILDYLRGFVAK